MKKKPKPKPPPQDGDALVVSIAVDPPLTPKGKYVIRFYPDPSDPQPAIYYTYPEYSPNPVLPRRVVWKLVSTLETGQFVMIEPKALNTQIFHGPKTPVSQEEYRLDNTHPSVPSGGALRGPALGLGLSLGWYYSVVLYGPERAAPLVTYPPQGNDRAGGFVLAYIDPVIIIRDEP